LSAFDEKNDYKYKSFIMERKLLRAVTIGEQNEINNKL
jgi:hypothetical protein